MLGVVRNPYMTPADQIMKAAAEDMRVGDTFIQTPVGVFFGEPGKTVPDPFSAAPSVPRRCGRTRARRTSGPSRVGATAGYSRPVRAIPWCPKARRALCGSR